MARDEVLNIRLSAEERAIIHAASKRVDRTDSDFVRRAALEAAKETP